MRVQVDPGRSPASGSAWRTCARRSRGRRSTSPRASSAGGARRTTIAANDQLFDAAAYRNSIVGLPERRRGAPRRRGQGRRRRREQPRRRLDQRQARGRAHHPAPARRQHHRHHRPRQGAAPLAQRVDLAGHRRSSVALDRAQTIRASVHDVELTLVLSVVLVVLVVFIFLRSVRATIIPSVAVPLSLVGTFGVMYLLGYSLDNLSLMALTISTGFVVDDAIVVTENVARYVEEGEPPLEAALKGAKQIGFTIVSITVSLLAVFIPILLMGGIIGRLFREFAVTLSIAIAVSAVVSLTLTPMMCARLLCAASTTSTAASTSSPSASSRGWSTPTTAALRWVLAPAAHARRHLRTLALTVFLFIIVPKGLLPAAGHRARSSGFSDAPQDISFPAMKDAAGGGQRGGRRTRPSST